MTSYTVTAAQSVNTAAGMQLYVLVLDNAAMAATPATGTSTTAYHCSVTTTQDGSIVCGTIGDWSSDVTETPESNTTITEYLDATNGCVYAGFYSSATTGTPGSTVYGSTKTYNTFYASCGVEILSSGGSITIDASSPPATSTQSSSATSLTTPGFSPPGGSLLVAMVTTNGQSVGTMTMTISSSPVLTWTTQVSVSSPVSANSGWIGVATAVVPAAGNGPPLNQGLLPNFPAIITSNAGWRNAGHSR